MVKNNYKWGWGATCPYCGKTQNYESRSLAEIIEKSGCHSCFLKGLATAGEQEFAYYNDNKGGKQ